MRSTRHWGSILESLPAPVLARLIESRLVDEWPVEVTSRGRAVARSAPATNMWRLALMGNPSTMIENWPPMTEIVFGRQKE